jgi:hypothetical protein
MEAAHLAWTGGFTYLHRYVPLYAHFGPGRESGLFNYVIAAEHPQPGERVATLGGFALIRLHRRACTPDPAYSWRLP